MLHTIHFNPTRFEWFTARLESGVLHVPRQGIIGDLPEVSTPATVRV
jgi:CRISPR-associated protein Cas5d